jgi:integrase
MRLAGLAPTTQITYIDAVRQLAEYYRRSPDQLSEEEVRGYILDLRGRGIARGTFKTKHYGLQFLYRHAQSRLGVVLKKKIRQPKQKRLPSALTDAQVRDLLGRITNPTFKTCCAVIYACGLRTTEAAALEIGAIDRTNLHLHIIGKGNKERIVPLPQPILEDLRRLWKITVTHDGCSRTKLAPGRSGVGRLLAPSLLPHGRSASAGFRRELSVIAMPPGSSNAASISGSCRSCSATTQSPPRPSTRI